MALHRPRNKHISLFNELLIWYSTILGYIWLATGFLIFNLGQTWSSSRCINDYWLVRQISVVVHFDMCKLGRARYSWCYISHFSFTIPPFFTTFSIPAALKLIITFISLFNNFIKFCNWFWCLRLQNFRDLR